MHPTFAYFSQIWPYGSDPYTTSKSIPSCPFVIGNGICDYANMNHQCQFDGLDCCLHASLVNNGVCNQENLNFACGFDGNDCSYCNSSNTYENCCSSTKPCILGHGHCDYDAECANGLKCGSYNCGPDFSSFYNCCMLKDTSLANLTDPCPNPTLSGNGLCNLENNHAICNYDDGDCCPNKDLIGNGQCDFGNYNHVCHFDGGDCCYRDSKIGNGVCSYFHNLEMCNYDQGDCCDHLRIADGICDDSNNNRFCHYDGGDCCFGYKNTDRCSMCICIDVFNVISSF